ncbi:hypothetical protein G6F22_015382 [Rhizopus arrhizus]|nr:hypothetical protein G6F22_015382 [Rhizopus arrhizus]
MPEGSEHEGSDGSRGMGDGRRHFGLHDLVRLRAQRRDFHVGPDVLPGVLLVLLRHIDRRQVIAPGSAIGQRDRLQRSRRRIAVSPGTARRQGRCDAPLRVIGQADAAPVAGDDAIQAPAAPLIADPVAESVDDLRRIEEDLLPLQRRMGDGVVGLHDSRVVVARHHPVEVVLGSVRRMPQEAFARLAALEGTEAGEEPSALGIPRGGHAELWDGLARISAAGKNRFTAAARQ